MRNIQSLKKLAEGTDEFFPIFICDAGYQFFGTVRHSDENFVDFRDIVDEAGAVFLGKYTYYIRINMLLFLLILVCIITSFHMQESLRN